LIDIHNHILPGVDDGPDTIEESIQMAKDAYEQGIQTIIASPHHMNGIFTNEKEDIIQQVQVLNELIEAHEVPVEVIPGQEIRLYEGILEDMKNEELLTLNNSQYLLLELPFDHVPPETEQVITQLLRADITPIIAHPERYREIREEPGILYDFVQLGAVSQITASSLLGVFGKEVEKFSYQLFENNLSHFIASDAHNTTVRWFDLAEAYLVLEKKLGNSFVEQLKENSQCVIEKKLIYREEPVEVNQSKKRRFF